MDKEDDQLRFARLYARHAADPGQFWQAVKQEFPSAAARLQVEGKLGFLTLNNAPLSSAYNASTGLSSPFSTWSGKVCTGQKPGIPCWATEPDQLFTQGQQAFAAFFDRYPELLELYERFTSSPGTTGTGMAYG